VARGRVALDEILSSGALPARSTDPIRESGALDTIMDEVNRLSDGHDVSDDED